MTGPSDHGQPIIVVGSDPLTARNVRKAADGLGLAVSEVGALDHVDDHPSAVVMSLGPEGALDVVASAKQRWPKAMVVGCLPVPDAKLWEEAENAGCDAVTTRGAIGKMLVARLPAWLAEPGGPRLRLFAMGDIAGRLGLVARLADTPLGPIAVYHLAGEVLVIDDACSHAGAKLSEGEISLEDGAVTCPEHGSRFDTRTGDRVRGPADDPIRTHRVIIQDGVAYVGLD